MPASLVRGHRGAVARRAVLVIPAVVAGGFFIGLTRSAAADSTDTAGVLETSSITATSAPTTPVAAVSTTPVVSPAVDTEPSAVEPAPPASAPVVEPAPSAASIAPAVEVTEASTTPEAPVAVAVTEAVVEAVVETTVAPPAQQSSCRSDLPGAVMSITMADISYECAVYPGGQSVIDAGVATVITADESPWALAGGPGEAGTLWITGHRVSHGGPFAAVPDLADGAIVTVSNGMVTASYVIVGRSYVEIRDGYAVDASGQATDSATMDAVLRPDRNAEVAPRLLLQTCDSANFRWMIYADLIEG